jgi:hypothetical protein
MSAKSISLVDFGGSQFGFCWVPEHQLLAVNHPGGTTSFDRGQAHLLMTYLQDKLVQPGIIVSKELSDKLDKAIQDEMDHPPRPIITKED